MLGYLFLYLALSLVVGMALGKLLKAHDRCGRCALQDAAAGGLLPATGGAADAHAAVQLHCHPASPCPAVRRFDVRIRREGPVLRLTYRIEGDIEAIALPEPAAPERTDGLWQHTCFEAFVRRDGGQGYFEFNFSPSIRWAIYRFEGYREGMAPAGSGRPPAIVFERRREAVELDAAIDLLELGDGWADAELELAVTAVVETRDGRLAYWSCRHPAGKPDFHHPDGFALTVGGGAA